MPRDLPPWLQTVLNKDVALTKDCFEHFDRKYGLQTYRPYLKYLELSCHGIPWLCGAFAMMYLFPSGLQLWINLLWCLGLDIVIVAIVKVSLYFNYAQ